MLQNIYVNFMYFIGTPGNVKFYLLFPLLRLDQMEKTVIKYRIENSSHLILYSLVIENKFDGGIPVSYTHLDVYKRQV